MLHLVLLLQHEICVLLTILNCCAYSKSCDNMYCKMIKRKIKQNAVNVLIATKNNDNNNDNNIFRDKENESSALCNQSQ